MALAVAVAAVVSVAAQDPTSTETKEKTPREKLADAAKKTFELTNYTFKASVEVAGDLEGAVQIPEGEGRVDKEAGTLVRFGDQVEAARKGTKTVYKEPGGEWTRLSAAKPGAIGSFSHYLARIKTPHEQAQGFEKHFKEVAQNNQTERIGREDATIFEGDLTETGAKAILPLQGITELVAIFLPGAALSGRARAWVGESGRIVRYQTETRLSSSDGDVPFEATIVIKIDLSDVGETKVEIPDEARKALEAPEEKKPEKPAAPRKGG
jgi:hypothetical protein